MTSRTLRITLNGTGFAADYTAACYGLLPHKNGVTIELAGVTSGRPERAEAFARARGITRPYATHAEMLAAVRPDIDNICCANHVHRQYVREAAQAGVGVIVLEKPPLVWPGLAEGRDAPPPERTRETMAAFAEVLDAVRQGGSRQLYAEDFVYFDGVKGCTELLREAQAQGKGKILLQRGVCAHQGSHAAAGHHNRHGAGPVEQGQAAQRGLARPTGGDYEEGTTGAGCKVGGGANHREAGSLLYNPSVGEKYRCGKRKTPTAKVAEQRRTPKEKPKRRNTPHSKNRAPALSVIPVLGKNTRRARANTFVGELGVLPRATAAAHGGAAVRPRGGFPLRERPEESDESSQGLVHSQCGWSGDPLPPLQVDGLARPWGPQ